jgi:signal peptidase II
VKETLYDWGGLNLWLFRIVNRLHAPWYDRLMLALGELGDHRHFVFYFVAVSLALLANHVRERMRGIEWTRQDFKNEIALLVELSMAYVLVALTVGVVKSLIPMPRPFVQLYYTPGIVRFVGTYPPVTDYYASLPSTHAAFVAFLVTALWPKLHRYAYVRYAALALIFLVGWSRVAVGMQFPADVVYGALIGFAMTWPVRRYVYRMLGVPRQRRALS